MNEDNRPSLLILSGKCIGDEQVLKVLCEHYQVHQYDGAADAIEALRHGTYHAVLADAGDFMPLERQLVGAQAQQVLNTIGEGVCVVDAQGICRWSNHRMRDFSPQVFDRVKKICAQARSIFESQVQHLPGTRPRSKKFSIDGDEDQYFELIVSPVIGEEDGDGPRVAQVVAVVWDASSGKRLQQKIDAIDAAGRELARLESESIADMSPSQRLQVLQEKIITFSKDLMHFDHFAIRLLDKRANKLEIVMSEGLPSEALEIDLYAQPEGNGISGYVAATGRSYICHDTEKDPRYVLGLTHGKSSLTVPLRLFDKMLGVYNVESERVGAFNEDDRQFAEIFGRYVAMALNILDLLVVERHTLTGQLTDNVVQEMAQPLNDIVTEAQSLMEEYIGDDTMRHRLNNIIDHVSDLHQSIRNVAAGPKAILGEVEAEKDKPDELLFGKRVLIADDEANIRDTIANILRKHGCDCTVCKDGYEAISFIEQAPGSGFDLVISDIKMPHRNGYEIFAAARRQSDTLPVILMTGFGYDQNHSVVRASQEGLSSVMFKPFKVDQLLDNVHSAFGGPVTPATANRVTPFPA